MNEPGGERFKQTSPIESSGNVTVPEIAKHKEVIEDLYHLPRIKDLPALIQEQARRDLASVQENIEALDGLNNRPGVGSSFDQRAFQLLINKPVPLYAESVVRSTKKDHSLGVAKALKLLSPTFFEVGEESTWITQELVGATNKLRTDAQEVARNARDVTKLPGIKARMDAIVKMPKYEDRAIEKQESANEAIGELRATDLLFYHGTHTDPFLEMLRGNSLLSRRKQLEQNGSARFSTSEQKRESQELGQVVFAVDEPNWGYTRQPGEGGDSRFLKIPDDIWVVTDGGELIKNKEVRFFYTDGVHVFNENPDEGFALNFEADPMCFLMTPERYAVLRTIVLQDETLGERALEVLDRKVVLIPQDQINREQTSWQLDEDIKSKVKEKIKSSSPTYQIERQEGCIVPSGSFGEAQDGEKQMTYSWINRGEIPQTVYEVSKLGLVKDLNKFIRKSGAVNYDWDTLLPEEKLLIQELVARRVKFLEWVKEDKNNPRVMYIGCGFDKLPSEVFGQANMVNVSLEDYYFNAHLGEQNIQADVADLQNINEAFEVIYMHVPAVDVVNRGLVEMIRKLKPGGYLVFDYDEIPLNKNTRDMLSKTGDLLYPVSLPDGYEDMDNQKRSGEIHQLAEKLKKGSYPYICATQTFRVFKKKADN